MLRDARRLSATALDHGLATPLSVLALLLLSLVLGSCAHESRELLRGVLERSAPADVQRPLSFSNRTLSFEYPGNWRIDADDPSYDPDAYLDVNAPGQGKVIVQLVPGDTPPSVLVESISARMREILAVSSERELSRWGRHAGAGRELVGSFRTERGRIRIFAFRSSEATIVVTETRFDSDEPNNAPGYDLIERTFQLHPADRSPAQS